MASGLMWTNPQTGTEHCVGQRVMWIHGRKDYAEYGEIGTVVSVPNVENPEDVFIVQFDQPKNKKDINSGRRIPMTSDGVVSLKVAYGRTAARLREVAVDYEMAAAHYTDQGMPL